MKKEISGRSEGSGDVEAHRPGSRSAETPGWAEKPEVEHTLEALH